MINRLLGRSRLLLAKLTGIATVLMNPPRVIGYKKYANTPTSRALLCYLPIPVIRDLRGEPITHFSNDGIAVSLPRALNRLNYSVDIVSWDDTEFEPSQPYDLIILHGAKTYNKIFQDKRPPCKTIYFSTGSYWEFHNEQEKRRQKYFCERHNIELPLDRYITNSEEGVNQFADGIITLGSAAVQKTYSKFSNVESVGAATIFDTKRMNLATKDFRSSAKNWLFFSGGGNLHKGLDLLIDAFLNLDAELHICTSLGKEFEEYYAKELKNSPNIHYYGIVDTRSDQFYELMEKCAFITLPSCSEGGPGSVIDCMQHGLIPVVTKEAGINEDYGYIFNTIRVDSIRDQVRKLSELPESKLREQAEKSQKSTITGEYSLASFENRLVKSISKITQRAKS